MQAPCGGRAGEGGSGDAGTLQPGSDVVLVVPVSVESARAVAGVFSSASPLQLSSDHLAVRGSFLIYDLLHTN